jgi:hypothetical protein
MPVNPNTPAIIDTTKKISAHFRSVISVYSNLPAIWHWRRAQNR